MNKIMNKNKNKKKKGFTLIELIIVIAILAILAMILVPMIGSYRQKAEKSNIQASAKTVMSAIDAYNADNTPPITNGAGIVAALGASGDQSLDTSKISSAITSCTTLTGDGRGSLQALVDGDFTADTSGAVTYTNP